MKVGFLTFFWPTCDPDSGIARNFQRLALVLAARGHEVTVFHFNPRRAVWKWSRRTQEQGVTVIELPCWVIPHRAWTFGQPLSHFAALLRLALAYRPLDVIETTSYGGFATIYFRHAWWKKPPLLVRISTTGEQLEVYNGKNFPRLYDADKLETELIRQTPYLCTHTKAHRALICESLGLDLERIDVIPHGIDLPDPGTLYPVPGNSVLYVGRFETRKGTDTLLQALPLVLERAPDCVVNLVGAGGRFTAWRTAFLREHGQWAGQVRFAGRLPAEEVEELYRTCDFVVAPALYESFGIVYLEAMRHGKPVIGCYESGGAAEVIGDGGLLVPPKYPAELAEAILRLWTDRDFHESLSVHARVRAEYYSMARKAERTEKVYARLIQMEASAKIGDLKNPSS